MFASTNACALLGTQSIAVKVEARIEPGLPMFTIVGLRDRDARETKERVRCGMKSMGTDLPPKRITVNIAPADLPKRGAGFDLPICLALLAAMGVVDPERVRVLGSHGEVGLDGKLRSVIGTLAGALVGARAEWQGMLIAGEVAHQAAHCSIPVWRVDVLSQAVAHVRGGSSLPRAAVVPSPERADSEVDLSEVRGQTAALKGLEIAAAGGHNLLMYGPPGCGKTMLATRLPTILPKLSGDDALEVATIHDAAGLVRRCDDLSPPFRAPHHQVSSSALVGGGSASPVVGELSLAHHGVLFLDEMPEFRPSAIDALRQPLEAGEVVVRRAAWAVRFPAKLQLVAAMNLCRCGRFGSNFGKRCECTDQAITSYQQRISGAILSRFDLHCRLDVAAEALHDLPRGDSSATVAHRVSEARSRATKLTRLRWEATARTLLGDAARLHGLGGRTQAAIARVATTVCHLDEATRICDHHVASALGLAVPPSALEVEEMVPA